MKYCPKCNETKPITDFHSNKAKKDGLSVYCKACFSLYSKRKTRVEYEKTRLEKRKTDLHYIEYHKEYRKKNMKLIVEKSKIKYHSDPLEKLKQNFRNRLRKYIKRKQTPSKNILGCDWQTLKDHIESKFESGMNWDNHEQFGWHLDHIIPLTSAKNEEELIKLNHYTNLQPLWWRDNLVKNGRILE